MARKSLTVAQHRERIYRNMLELSRSATTAILADAKLGNWVSAGFAWLNTYPDAQPAPVEPKRRGPLPRTWRGSNGTVYGWRNGVVTDSTGVPIQMETCPPKMRDIFNGLAGAIAPDAWPAYQPK